MDKSHKVSEADGGVWSYSCPILKGWLKYDVWGS